MANYKIKLTPIDTFFFGGEKHTEKDGEFVSNYYVESNMYPQQTTMLGLLRYYLLLKNETFFKDNRITNKAQAAEIIGSSSFDYNKPHAGYGKISSIGPLYFQNKSQLYIFAPLDIGFEMEGFQLKKYKDGKQINYNSKEHFREICQYLIPDIGEKVKLSDIISDDPQVGNEKAGKGVSREEKNNKFYKQNAKKMTQGWSFCFDAEIEEASGIPDKKDELFIPFGGEKSFFKMEVEKQPPASFTLPVYFKRDYPFIHCLCDCFVSADILKESAFAVNRYASFRNLKTNVKTTEKYSGLSKKDPSQPERSNRYNLLQRGSILYFDNEQRRDEVKNLIEANNLNHCISIGFNKILTK